jgi:DUF3014 family protein
MPLDFRDYELLKTPEEMTEPPPPRRSAGVWLAGLILVAALAAAAYIAFGRRAASSPPAPQQANQAQPRAVQPLGGEPMPVDLPPLDESDALVRDLVKKLSMHPQIAAWLATDDLIRNLTVVVVNVAEGNTPAGHLGVLRPSSKFRVVERRGDTYIDPRSYDRYDTLAAAAESLDPQGSARLYATLKPRIVDAHHELGFAEASFDGTLERAIVQLLRTPVIDESARVEPKGIGYRFADQRLEDLTAAQKQLLRMGPRNVRRIQVVLRNLASALGIPNDRLPP